MRLLYFLFIWFYEKAVHLAAAFHPKAKKWINGRKDNRPPDTLNKPVIWIHCASLGEYDMAIPVITRLKKERPDHFFLVTFFSPSGMDHYKKRGEIVDGACFLPVDRKSKITSFLSHFNPELLILVKYEFWPNLVEVLKQRRIPIVSINTVLRKNQRFFKWYGAFFRRTLQSIDLFYAINAKTSLLLSDIGINNWKITGDTRYDRLMEYKQTLPKDQRIEEFLSDEKAIIVGSSWPADEHVVLQVVKRHPEHKYIIAPHEVDEDHIVAIENQLVGLTQRYTDKNDSSRPVLILNTIGHLTKAYAYAKLAYVGGAFKGKLHNILEPMVYEIPLVFGPVFDRNPEAHEAIHAGIAFSIQNDDDFEKVIENALRASASVKLLSNKLVKNHVGSSTLICDDITNRFLPRSSAL